MTSERSPSAVGIWGVGGGDKLISVEEEMQVAGHLSPPAQEKDEPQGNELLKGTQINDTVTKILAAQDETLHRLSEPHTCRCSGRDVTQTVRAPHL